MFGKVIMNHFWSFRIFVLVKPTTVTAIFIIPCYAPSLILKLSKWYFYHRPTRQLNFNRKFWAFPYLYPKDEQKPIFSVFWSVLPDLSFGKNES